MSEEIVTHTEGCYCYCCYMRYRRVIDKPPCAPQEEDIKLLCPFCMDVLSIDELMLHRIVVMDKAVMKDFPKLMRNFYDYFMDKFNRIEERRFLYRLKKFFKMV